MPKVSSYDEATALDDDDILYVVQDGASKKAKVGTLSQATRKAGLIGVPGTLGFGVGVCLEDAAGYTGLPGYDVIGHQNYGNYQYTDGSVMAWVPIFYYRIGHSGNPTYGQYGVNSIDIKGAETYADEATANADGYALHRAFIDGGVVQPGFMHDKYLCSDNAGTASSIRNGNPLSTKSEHNPISGLTGSPANNYGGVWAAAKTRGSQFFPASQFNRGAIALLALAHAQASTTTTFNAWYDASNNWPKGCNNNALGDHADADVSYTSDGYSNCGKTGSGVPFARTTHNGQESGICDINGPMWEILSGMTCVATGKSITGATQANPVAVTVVGHGFDTGDTVMITSIGGMTEIDNRLFRITVVDADTVTLDNVDGTGFSAFTSGGTMTRGKFYIAKESVAMKDFTGGNSLATDHFGATGVAAMMQAFEPGFRTDYPENGFASDFGDGAKQVLGEAVDGDEWLRAGSGMAEGTYSAAGTTLFGNDYANQYVRNELCVVGGGLWDYSSRAGVFARLWYLRRTSSGDSVGFRAASYI